MINGIIQGLCEWLYGLFLELIEYCANSLLGLMGTDLTFFEQSVPVIIPIYSIFTAVGWALLIGNLVFQALKSMIAGLGFEAENPAELFGRTFVFGFLLVFSRQLCEIGLSIAKKVIDFLNIPDVVNITTPDDSFFGGAGGASWVLVIIVGVILGIQLIKLFFEIGERYVVIVVMTLMFPIGLAMGGSKATKEISTSYTRMYGSMLLMMILNVLFLKLVLSGLATMPSGSLVLPWCVLMVAIVKVARKTDEIISKIGLNPAITGDPLGRGGRMLTLMAAKSIISSSMKNRMSHRTGGASSITNSGGSSIFSKISSGFSGFGKMGKASGSINKGIMGGNIGKSSSKSIFGNNYGAHGAILGNKGMSALNSNHSIQNTKQSSMMNAGQNISGSQSNQTNSNSIGNSNVGSSGIGSSSTLSTGNTAGKSYGKSQDSRTVAQNGKSANNKARFGSIGKNNMKGGIPPKTNSLSVKSQKTLKTDIKNAKPLSKSKPMEKSALGKSSGGLVYGNKKQAARNQYNSMPTNRQKTIQTNKTDTAKTAVATDIVEKIKTEGGTSNE